MGIVRSRDICGRTIRRGCDAGGKRRGGLCRNLNGKPVSYPARGSNRQRINPNTVHLTAPSSSSLLPPPPLVCGWEGVISSYRARPVGAVLPRQTTSQPSDIPEHRRPGARSPIFYWRSWPTIRDTRFPTCGMRRNGVDQRDQHRCSGSRARPTGRGGLRFFPGRLDRELLYGHIQSPPCGDPEPEAGA